MVLSVTSLAAAVTDFHVARAAFVQLNGWMLALLLLWRYSAPAACRNQASALGISLDPFLLALLAQSSDLSQVDDVQLRHRDVSAAEAH